MNFRTYQKRFGVTLNGPKSFPRKFLGKFSTTVFFLPLSHVEALVAQIICFSFFLSSEPLLHIHMKATIIGTNSIVTFQKVDGPLVRLHTVGRLVTVLVRV